MGFLDDQLYVALDLETSGINPYENEIIEIGAVRFNINGVIDKYTKLVTPQKKLDPASTKIHNLTPEILKEQGVSLMEGIQGLCKFLGQETLVFHNASFDLSFLSIAFSQLKITPIKNSYIDHLYLSRQYLKARKSHSLERIKEELEIDAPSHRAGDDAFITAQSMIFLLTEYADRMTSAKKYRSFLRYIRKVAEFRVTLPRNFGAIQKYVANCQKSGALIKVIHFDRGRRFQFPAKIEQLLVFNQVIYLRITDVSRAADVMAPASELSVVDSELGELPLLEL